VNRKWDALLAVAGLALFAFAAGRIGWGAVMKTIVEARTGVAIIVGLSLVRLFLQTRSWSIALRADSVESPASALAFIRLASQGIGYLSVLGPVASEPMKISLLRKWGSGAAATLVDTGVYWFTSGLVGVAGCLSAILLLAHSRHSTVSLAIFGLILGASLFLIAGSKPRLSALGGALGARCPRWLQSAARLEVALRRFETQHPSSIRSMFLLGIACQALVGAEVLAMFWTLKIPFHAGVVLGVEGATRAIKIMAGWMPARIGADESGTAGAFLAFGLSPASGLALALARRSRDLLGALIGLIWLALGAGVVGAAARRIPVIADSKEEEQACKLY
jgi:hypothetical protein